MRNGTKLKKLLNPFSRRRFLESASLTALGFAAPSFFNKVSHAESNLKKDSSTGLVMDERLLAHFKGKGHPESPARLDAIQKRLTRSGLLADVNRIVPSVDPLPYIRSIHSETHLQRINQQAYDESLCRLTVSAALDAVDAVCSGQVTNAFCATRPPGHHATNEGEYGFCFYNNVAIAARYAQQKYKLKKILIVDWDYHHGNGTEWAFYDDPSVLFFSTHALYAFPGTGSANKTGSGDGQGFNINVPLPSGADDKAIMDAFTHKLIPAANAFRPDLVLVSAGFDARKDDLLGDFAVTDSGFVELTKLVMAIAKQHCNSRLVSILEGGYNTKGLALAVEAHLQTLLSA